MSLCNIATKTICCRQYLFKQIFLPFHSFIQILQAKQKIHYIQKERFYLHERSQRRPITISWGRLFDFSPLWIFNLSIFHLFKLFQFQTITFRAPSHHDILGAVKGVELPQLNQVITSACSTRLWAAAIVIKTKYVNDSRQLNWNRLPSCSSWSWCLWSWFVFALVSTEDEYWTYL